jgi:hypothetical protein
VRQYEDDFRDLAASIQRRISSLTGAIGGIYIDLLWSSMFLLFACSSVLASFFPCARRHGFRSYWDDLMFVLCFLLGVRASARLFETLWGPGCRSFEVLCLARSWLLSYVEVLLLSLSVCLSSLETLRFFRFCSL